jgi:hypothetical protein
VSARTAIGGRRTARVSRRDGRALRGGGAGEQEECGGDEREHGGGGGGGGGGGDEGKDGDEGSNQGSEQATSKVSSPAGHRPCRIGAEPARQTEPAATDVTPTRSHAKGASQDSNHVRH